MGFFVNVISNGVGRKWRVEEEKKERRWDKTNFFTKIKKFVGQLNNDM